MTLIIKIIDDISSTRAEPVRMALTAGGVSFQDVRYTRNVINKLYPTGTFPMMIGKGCTSTNPDEMLRYAGTIALLYWDCYEINFVVDTVQLVATELRRITDAGREDFLHITMHPWMEAINARYKHLPGSFLFGPKMTIADIKLAWIVDAVCGGSTPIFSDACMENYPFIMRAVNAVYRNEKIKAYKETVKVWTSSV